MRGTLSLVHEPPYAHTRHCTEECAGENHRSSLAKTLESVKVADAFKQYGVDLDACARGGEYKMHRVLGHNATVQ